LCPGFHSKIRFDFNGNNGTSGTYTALDTCLTSVQNDSIIILYRKNAADDWKEVDKYTKQKLGLKQGFFICDTLRFGEYAFANKQGGGSVGISEISTSAGVLKVFPNPASSQVNLKLDNIILNGSEYVEIKNIEGKVIYTARLNAKEQVVDCTAFAKGTYLISVFRDKKVLDATKLILQ
jgi:hypothetical protein